MDQKNRLMAETVLYVDMWVGDRIQEMKLAGIRRYAAMRRWNVRVLSEDESRPALLSKALSGIRPVGCIVEGAGVHADLDIAAAMEQMSTAFTKPVDTAAVAELKRRMDEARSMLWIFDNCGEAVFDRLLMEPYREKITLAVRGKPAFNDMTRAELSESGYPDGFAAGGVVSNDDGVPGVVDATCCENFRKVFSSADLVVAKWAGQLRDHERADRQADSFSLPCEMSRCLPHGWCRAEDDSDNLPLKADCLHELGGTGHCGSGVLTGKWRVRPERAGLRLSCICNSKTPVREVVSQMIPQNALPWTFWYNTQHES